jgi:hypothetical protein
MMLTDENSAPNVLVNEKKGAKKTKTVEEM